MRATVVYRLSWEGLSENMTFYWQQGTFSGNTVTELGCLVLGCSLGPVRREFVHGAVEAKMSPFCFSNKGGIVFR